MADSARPTVHLTVRVRNHHRTAVLLLALAALTVTTGCSSGSHDASPKQSATPSATQSVDPNAAEKAKVLEAYRNMWEARNRTYAQAKLDPKLSSYAGNKALSNIKVTLLYYQDHGTLMKGQPVNSPQVTGIDTESKPKKATITDCVDTSRYDEVDAKTGKKVPVGTGSRRHVYNATAINAQGKWIIWTTDIDRERTC
ncbi:hypothetical protein [Streptomyces mirabilis]|uniref:hypothetical protein n=1 Tax=Streptomyces mirabilis TaxID=68239 RepID=UPI002251B6FB|nr:hypothetical protein [Streptomyces mirabilis]MCX4429077.1 hypothetical protein [Streptomyces mirabilis]